MRWMGVIMAEVCLHSHALDAGEMHLQAHNQSNANTTPALPTHTHMTCNGHSNH
jgi:hypothetical protein